MKKSSFVEGTLIATLAIIFTKILGMLYVIPFYSMLDGGKGTALYGYAYSIYVVFLDISSAGLPIAISKIINEYNTLGMNEAKVRSYKIGKNIMVLLAFIIFSFMMIFAKEIAHILIGELKGGNTIEDVALAIRSVSFAILIVPFLSVTKGYLQGHKIISIPSFSQIIEQVVRITFILAGTYLTLNILDGTITTAVCISVFAAFVGGVAAYLYIVIKMKTDKSGIIDLDVKYKKDNVSNKEIIKKIFTYAVPFIIINIVSSCYNFIDLTLLIRSLTYIKMDAAVIEFVSTATTTWAPKINMIVTSVAMGMSTSLIPTMVTAFTLKKWDEVNDKFNQALQILIFVSLPMTIGLAMLADAVWAIFYGANIYGTYILRLNLFTGLFLNIYMITTSALQGLNKFKIVYLSTISGFATNALLDVPIILLYNKIGIPPYLGAVTASIIGYILSVAIALIALHKECNLNYKATFKTILKMLIPTISMIIVVIILKLVFPLNINSRLSSLLYVTISGILGGITYFVIAFKQGLLVSILGKRMASKIVKILTLGKVKI